ncbi:DUF4181 domain-containing protein [Pseudalkalibacillus berkeleyi]|uniref:DUF4181 domain-containing protein n=1 Tax=Pseudalkalibacillus berkeleyi TaxID=1069813 RepID=A0ABS9GXX8_9BACL|nr:DUF4181 domain-containing protein [Pseudalkalibacillus berkeleyi]MCF6136458.1 DUF4181 domain-containing protein [Pseudalkalibacillus berkeleyi]
MNFFTGVSLVTLIAIYLWISQYYLKRHLGIQNKWRWLLSEDRNKLAVMIDVIILVLFIFTYMFFNFEENHYSTMVRVSPMFMLFFLQNINQGIEKFLVHRSDQSYYHNWLGAFVILVTFIIMFIGEQQ